MVLPTNARALVVDDETELRSILRWNLEDFGFHVSEATNGREALTALERETFDVIFSDIRMPEMTGVEFLKQCRDSYPAYPHVVIITGYTDTPASTLIDLGAKFCLNKPVDSKDLATVISKLWP